jgi:hypothetical protein
MFLFWFLLGCLLHVCLPYADELYTVEKTTDLSGSFSDSLSYFGGWGGLKSFFFREIKRS